MRWWYDGLFTFPSSSYPLSSDSPTYHQNNNYHDENDTTRRCAWRYLRLPNIQEWCAEINNVDVHNNRTWNKGLLPAANK